MQGYRDLMVWQKAMDLVLAIYRMTGEFPKNEMYGLISQMRRAALSIPSNLAEGHGLKPTRATLRHLAIAGGALAELETQLEIATRLGYLAERDKELSQQANEVGRMRAGLRRSLKARNNQNED